MSEEKSAISFESGQLLKRALVDLNPHSLQSVIGSVPIEPVVFPLSQSRNVATSVFRADKLDDKLGGNKFFKLWGHLQAYRSLSDAPPLVSFGGAYSNHLYALAALGQLLDLDTIGVVRGEPPTSKSATLIDLAKMGMRLHYMSRTDYRQRDNERFVKTWLKQSLGMNNAFVIPEGGGGERGRKGCAQLGRYLSQLGYTHIVHACGTGTTLQGMLEGGVEPRGGSEPWPHWLGISALRSKRSIINPIVSSAYLSEKQISWSLSNQFHEGGFAKLSNRLREFIVSFEKRTAIPLDRVYTGKVFYAVACLLEQGYFQAEDRVLIIHSGGIQGNRP